MSHFGLREVVLHVCGFSIVDISEEIKRARKVEERENESDNNEQPDEKDKRIAALEDALAEQECFMGWLCEFIQIIKEFSWSESDSNSD